MSDIDKGVLTWAELARDSRAYAEAMEAMSDDPVLALRRDIERLRAYARKKERQIQLLLNEIADMSGIERKTVSVKKMREADGVADLMDADR